MKDLKLTIDLLPRGAWGNDLSKTLSKKDWDKLRDACYKRADNRCSICGQSGQLHAHEVWEFNIPDKTQTLKDIAALCGACHGVKHFRNSERIGYGENAKAHFMFVNKCDAFTFAGHCFEAETIFNERNAVLRWKIIAELDKFGGNGIEHNQRNIPLIADPYKDIDWNNVRHTRTGNTGDAGYDLIPGAETVMLQPFNNMSDAGLSNAPQAIYFELQNECFTAENLLCNS